MEPQTSCRKFQSGSDSDSPRSTWTGGEEVTQRDSVCGGGGGGAGICCCLSVAFSPCHSSPLRVCLVRDFPLIPFQQINNLSGVFSCVRQKHQMTRRSLGAGAAQTISNMRK